MTKPKHDDDDQADPQHNKDLAIEILDKKPSQPQSSLAEMFQSKKKLVSKHDPQDGQTGRKDKTKEELFELRRQMMKRQHKKQEVNEQPDLQKPPVVEELAQPGKEELMKRLATGKKTQIDQKEMKRLTKQNYANLPEIKKKREEEIKRQENQARKAATQEYLKQLDEQRKKKAALVQKKREQRLEQLNNI